MLIKILKIARSEPEELEIRCHEETEEVKDMIATYGQKADFMDFSSLEKVMDIV